MATIVPQTVYTKTAKGILEIRNKTVKLPRDLGLVFLSVDGKASVADLLPRSGMTAPQLHHALNTLVSEGYIKVVSSPVRQAGEADDNGLDLDFTATHATSKLNMEAATRALAEAEATKRAQQEARAALEARLRQDAEARARALAETRAQSEAEARAKAEEAARIAAEERLQAEVEASTASDPAVRAQAEARVRAAAAAIVRAEAEAQARAEAEERARALAEAKKAAEEEAREEAESRAKSEEQAQARASAEARAREALEAQIQAMADVRAHADNPDAPEAEEAREKLRELEVRAERAREAAKAVARAEGVVEEEMPAAELHFDDLAQKLTAKVQAGRRAREEAERQAREALGTSLHAAEKSVPTQDDGFPALRLAGDPGDRLDRAAETPRVEPGLPAVDVGALAMPVISFEPTPVPTDSTEPGAEPMPTTALERAMAQAAARAQAQAAGKASAAEPAPAGEAEPAPAEEAASGTEGKGSASGKLVPTLDEDEPMGHERLNVDRTAHDILAEAAEARRKAEVDELIRNASAARKQRMEEDARRAATALRQKRRKQALAGFVITLGVASAVAVAALQFVSLDGFISGAQQSLSERLNQPATISKLRYVLFPSPRLVLEGITIGKSQGVRVDRLDAHALPFALLGEPKVFDTVEAKGVTIEPGMLGTIPSWTGGRTATAAHVNRLQLGEVKLNLPGSKSAALSGVIVFAPNGTVKQAVLTNENLKLDFAPQQSGMRVTLNAHDWKLPLGPAVTFSYLTVDGIVDKEQFASTQVSGRVGGGVLEATLAAKWAGPVIVAGDFRIQGARLQELLPSMAPDFSIRGNLNASGSYTTVAETAAALGTKAQIESTFTVVRGELPNIDLMRAIQSPGSNMFRGGRTAFDELSGSLHFTGGHYSYRKLQLSSGPLNASGNMEVTPGGHLSGRLSAEVAAKGTVMARSALTISGTVKEPQLRR